ncbi:MAG: virulence RhuM family protein [Prevotellaceae bacterium]|jgi:prophage antirepressor-like protein|nr:virulence RhuM family protein [Prevotellaceae bacterium]
MKDRKESGEIILYQPDGSVQVEVRLDDETVWLTQAQIASLFGVKQPAISKHLNNIYATGELDEEGTYSILEYMGNDGKQKYTAKFYNLDAILSVGYRVNSRNATLFRRWATQVLKEHLLRGYTVNQRLTHLEEQVSRHEEKIEFFIRTALPPSEGIFFDGQIFDAYHFVADLIRRAEQSIVLMDNYVDESVLLLLSKRKSGVSATIYTSHPTPQLQNDLRMHNMQYPPITIASFNRSHDRFLLIDDDVYHIGASLKDVGKKWFAFSHLKISATELLGMM